MTDEITIVDEPSIQIDGVQYKVSELSERAKEIIASLQFVDGELARHRSVIAALETSKIAYQMDLAKNMPGSPGDSTKN